MNRRRVENNQKSLRKAIYEVLKEEILYGYRPPGTRLLEMELSKEKGASRTPIREAIKMLADDGLVTIVPNRGAYVTQISLKELKEILEVRVEIDGMTAYYATKRIEREEIIALEESIKKYQKAFEEDNSHDIVYWDTEYHNIMVKATKNKVLIDLVGQLREELLRFRHIYYEDIRKNHDTVQDHIDLMRAIKDGKPDMARRIAENHMKLIINKLEYGYDMFEDVDIAEEMIGE